MKYVWIDEGSQSGPVTGLNRGAVEGELESNVSTQALIWEMNYELYKVVSGVFTPFTQEEKDAYDLAKQEEKDLQAAIDAIDEQFLQDSETPVDVLVNGVTYTFAGGFDSSLYIDNARQLADNLNENDVELWDIYGEPHIFSKSDANTIAVAVGLSFRTAYNSMKTAKKNLKE